MRTDCTLDRKQVICRNSSLIGFSTHKLRQGYFFTYRAPDSESGFARMLGRIAFAPALAGDKEHIKGWILAMELSHRGNHAYERWINPLWVTEAYAPEHAAFAAFFFADKLPYNMATMRRLMAHGSVCSRYIGAHAERVAEFAVRDKQIADGKAKFNREVRS